MRDGREEKQFPNFHKEPISKQEILRNSCADLSLKTQFIWCHKEKIQTYAVKLIEAGAPENLDPGPSKHSNQKQKISFVLLRNCTNFGSGWHPFLNKEPGMSGARTTAFRLSRWLEKEGTPSAQWLSRVTPEMVCDIFGQSYVSPIDKLIDNFVSSWRDFGRKISTKYDGEYEAFIEAAGNSAVRLSEMLSTMRLWNDAYSLDGQDFPFLKRAQLTAFDLAHFCADDRRCEFYDLDKLTMFADNLVPHTLKVDGVLEYSLALNARIERGEPIIAGSREEMEIRAMAVHAVELIAESCEAEGKKISPCELSSWIWNRGQSAKYKAYLRHRTRTVHY